MYRTHRFLTLFVLVALLVSACQPIIHEDAQPSAETAKLSATEVAAIHAIVETRMAQTQIPGFAVAVVQHGEMVYAEGFGVAEMGTDHPITPQTIFQLASTSKPITAIAMMQLVEAGKIQLDAHVTDYLPYFKLADERYRDITITQILTHRSGLPEGGGFLGVEEGIVVETDAGAAERYVRGLANLELLFAPGEDWSYSDMGYNVLGDVIAKASGQLFEEYVQEHIFTPLGMTQSTFLLSDVPTTALAQPHMRNAEGQMAKAAVMPYTRPFAPSDTLFSSVADMSRLARASFQHGELDGTRILSEEHWQQMWTIQTPTWFGDLLDYLARDYAYGWYWGQVAGHPVVHHAGTEAGYQNIFLLAPDDELAVITMGNALGPDEDFFYAFEIGQDVLKVLLASDTVSTSATANLPVPRFEPSACKYPILADTNAECGYLVVPEDRMNPDSPTTRVHVIKYPSTSETPAPDPIIAVPGGPGASGSFYAWLF
ncbi:MAG: beta-lactamase family protein, partial [Caldilineaceae bacterium]|nr:beta-lactamase family protein [Caldilineaceae bacterium]